MSSKPASRFLDPTTPPSLITLVLLASVGAVSMNIILPSLPAVQRHFGTNLFTVQFLLSGYLFMNGILQLVLGPVSDRYGRRPVTLWCLGIFAVASMVCALAPNTTILVAARLIQALVVATFVVSRAAVRDMLPANQAAAMLGYVAMGMSVAPMIAPTVGGVLQELADWPAVFWSLAIIGLLVLALAWRDMGETNFARSTSFGQQVRQYPRLLTSRRFWGYAIANAFASGCFFALLGGAPFVGVEIYGLSPGTLGAYFIFTPAGYFVGNLISARLSTRVGLYGMILAGALVVVIGMVVAIGIIQGGVLHPLGFFLPTIFIGLGNGMVIPNASAGMMNVYPHLAGTAAGLGGSMMTLGGAAMSALVVPFLTVESGPMPLILFILASASVSLAAALYSIWIEHEVRRKKA